MRWFLKHRAIIGVLMVGALGLSACQSDSLETLPGPALAPAGPGVWDSAMPPATHAALNKAFAQARSLPGSAALTVAIRTGKSGQWQATTPERAKQFWWASVGKLVTTILILQEVEAGRLSLDDNLSQVPQLLPQYAALKNITVRHLLTHTSGIPDFARLNLLAGQRGLVDRGALVRTALAEEPEFAPGEGWDYSNTGFLLLQEILEAINQQPYSALVTARIAQPLGLAGFAAPDTNLASDVTLPNLSNPPPASEFPPNIGGAGSVIAAADEMAVFWQAAMAGQLVDPKLLQEALSILHPIFGSDAMQIGAGMIVYPASDNNGFWLGHGGGAEQVGALVLFSSSRQMVVAIAGIGPGVQAMEIANIFIETIDQCEKDLC